MCQCWWKVAGSRSRMEEWTDADGGSSVGGQWGVGEQWARWTMFSKAAPRPLSHTLTVFRVRDSFTFSSLPQCLSLHCRWLDFTPPLASTLDRSTAARNHPTGGSTHSRIHSPPHVRTNICHLNHLDSFHIYFVAMTTSGDLADVLAGWPTFTSLSLSSPSPHIVHIELCGGKANTMTRLFWTEIQSACQLIAEHSSTIRVVLLTGRGNNIFSAGLDLNDHADLLLPPSSSASSADVSRVALSKLATIRRYQQSFTALEQLPQPVLALVHGAAVGGAVDLLTAACVRLATVSATLSVKEVDIGMAADVGTLQRIHHCVGSSSTVRDWCYTGRTVSADEAASVGFFSQPLCRDKEEGLQRLLQLGQRIASKSPIAVLGTKRALLYARDHSVAEGLENLAVWNMTMLSSDDIQRSLQAARRKQQPIYSNL